MFLDLYSILMTPQDAEFQLEVSWGYKFQPLHIYL